MPEELAFLPKNSEEVFIVAFDAMALKTCHFIFFAD